MAAGGLEMMGYERLDVYRCSIELLGCAARIVKKLPSPMCWTVGDQLERAALSVVLNIAEGSGKLSDGDSRRFFGTARGSAMECAAIADACRVLGVVSANEASEMKSTAERCVAMLTRLARPRRSRSRHREPALPTPHDPASAIAPAPVSPPDDGSPQSPRS